VLTCVQVRDLAPELALGVLTGAERAEAVAHVNECARCRALLNELSGAADVLTLLVPEKEPPPGFEKAVLDHMHTRRTRGTWLRRVGAAAVVAAAACIVTLVVVRVVDRDRDSQAPASAASMRPEVAAAPMIGDGDQTVGQVFATSGDHPWAYLFVNYQSIQNGSYRITVNDGAGAEAVGDMQVDDGSGFWGGPIDELDGAITVALVAADGTTVCEAELA
jgi:Putative zinc-finger